MRPVYTNAVLTKIGTEGFAEDYRDEESADETRWQGSSPCYVRENMLTEVANGNLDLVKTTDILVDAELGEPRRGDDVTYSWLGVSHERKVRDVEPFTWDNALVGYRLYLESG